MGFVKKMYGRPLIHPEKKYVEIIYRLANEFSTENEDTLKKDTAKVQQDLINRGLFNSTIKVSKLLELHYQHLNKLVESITFSIEKIYTHLRPMKCKKHLLHIVEKEYENIRNRVPGWLHASQLLDEKMLVAFEQDVISKKHKAIKSLENKCVLLEDQWRRKSRKRLVKMVFLVITAILIPLLGWIVPKWVSGNDDEIKPGLETKLRITTVDPNTGKTPLNIRTKERVEELKELIIKEKIDSWLFRKHPSFKVTKDDGSVIEYSNLEYAGAIRDTFWRKDYIDQFLSKGIKRILDETGQECKTNGLRAEEPLKEAAALLNGIIWNIYDRMAEVDFKLRKQRGDSEAVIKKNVDEKIKVMDEKLREHLRAALELYSDSSQ